MPPDYPVAVKEGTRQKSQEEPTSAGLEGSLAPVEGQAVPATREQELLARVLEYSDPLAVGEVLESLDWTIRHELSTLIAIADSRDTKDGDRMRALATIRGIVRDSLEQSGLLARIRETRTSKGEDGERVTRMAEAVVRIRDPLLKGLRYGANQEVADDQFPGQHKCPLTVPGVPADGAGADEGAAPTGRDAEEGGAVVPQKPPV